MNKNKQAKVLKVIEIIGFFLTIFSIWYSFYLSEQATLISNHTIDYENNKLIVSVKNKALFKETGNISFFRIEVSDSKPMMIVKSLKPNENFTFNLGINIGKKNVSVVSSFTPIYPALFNCSLSAYQLYYVTEETSISYRISCDNCPSQGIVRRIPDFQSAELKLILNPKDRNCGGLLTIYSWPKVSLRELS